MTQTQTAPNPKPAKAARPPAPDAVTEHPDLMKALLAAQRDLPAIAKESFNDFAQFHYSSADSIIEQARTVLHRHGLMAWVADTSYELIDGEPLKAHVKLTLELFHMRSEKSLKFTRTAFAEPAKGKPLDKAILGAETGALGYWLRGLLMTARLDVNEIDARDDRGYDPTKIGNEWVDKWLTPTLKAMGLSPDVVRQQLVKHGFNATIVAQKPWHWPIEWKERIKVGLSRHPRAKDIEPVPEPDAEIRELDQQEEPAPNASTVRTADPVRRAPGRAAASSLSASNGSTAATADALTAAFGGKPPRRPV